DSKRDSNREFERRERLFAAGSLTSGLSTKTEPTLFGPVTSLQIADSPARISADSGRPRPADRAAGEMPFERLVLDACPNGQRSLGGASLRVVAQLGRRLVKLVPRTNFLADVTAE